MNFKTLLALPKTAGYKLHLNCLEHSICINISAHYPSQGLEEFSILNLAVDCSTNVRICISWSARIARMRGIKGIVESPSCLRQHLLLSIVKPPTLLVSSTYRISLNNILPWIMSPLEQCPLFWKILVHKKEHYSNFCTFEIAILLNVPGHYLRKYDMHSSNRSLVRKMNGVWMEP